MSVHQINPQINDNIFLEAEITDEKGEVQTVHILPDSGNRAR
jgi:hypothetical protein